MLNAANSNFHAIPCCRCSRCYPMLSCPMLYMNDGAMQCRPAPRSSHVPIIAAPNAFVFLLLAWRSWWRGLGRCRAGWCLYCRRTVYCRWTRYCRRTLYCRLTLYCRHTLYHRRTLYCRRMILLIQFLNGSNEIPSTLRRRNNSDGQRSGIMDLRSCALNELVGLDSSKPLDTGTQVPHVCRRVECIVLSPLQCRDFGRRRLDLAAEEVEFVEASPG